MEYNGGVVLAMVGKNCVAIGSDKRFGIQAQTIGMNFPKIYKVHDQLFFGLAGLATDNQTFSEKVKFRTNLYKLREEREIKPSTFANMVSGMLYEKRFGPWFIEPVIAGLEGPDSKPFICATDLIGAALFAKDFVLAGSTANEQLFGMCESLWKPDMEPDQLFEVTSHCLLSAMDRDALSGWGAVVHVITKDKIVTKNLKTRQD